MSRYQAVTAPDKFRIASLRPGLFLGDCDSGAGFPAWLGLDLLF